MAELFHARNLQYLRLHIRFVKAHALRSREKMCIRDSPGCILTDVGSVKGEIHRKVTELDMAYNFIGGHPMAGSEHMGYEHSTDHLIENAYYILTPSEEVSLDKIGKYTELVTSIGALPMILTWDEHDFITAAVSHLPHIVAASLVNVVKKLDSPLEHMKTCLLYTSGCTPILIA